MAVARGQVLEMVRGLARRFPEHGIEGEVYVTAPGAEIDEAHPLVGAIDAAHAEVFGAPPERDVTRWFSDASVLTRYGDRDRELRHVERAPRHGEGREPRDRRARQDRRGLRARGDEGLRGRVSIYSCQPICPPRSTTVRPTTCSGMPLPSLTLASSQGLIELRELGLDLAVLYVYPRTGSPGRPPRTAGTRSRRARLHAAVVRVPRPRRRARELGARVAGLSAQTLEEQVELAGREHIPSR